MTDITPDIEWLEADGLGGFASGTASLERTRRYHALLLTARRPPVERFVLVNGLEVECVTHEGVRPLSAQRYAPDVLVPGEASCLESFAAQPWPQWTFRLGERTTVIHEIFVPRHHPAVVCRWRLVGPAAGALLNVRPLFSGRNCHHTHRSNPLFQFDHRDRSTCRISWQPYETLPYVHAWHNGNYKAQPDWYYNFLYLRERERGLDDLEDLAVPGLFQWDLTRQDAVLMFESREPGQWRTTTLPQLAVADVHLETKAAVEASAAELLERAREQRSVPQVEPIPAGPAVEAYFVRRGDHESIIAGYPWFTDWGRDTFIALRGFGFALGQLDRVEGVLLAWGRHIDGGMIPNRFPDETTEPEFHSVDASLWFVLAVHRFVAEAAGRSSSRELVDHAETILAAYKQGTRHGIILDEQDGLLRAGEINDCLTWMDARVDDHAATPRVGKPVEIQALWLNALRTSPNFASRWKADFERGCAAVRNRFWNARRECLFDVIDVNQGAGCIDHSLRPNQVFAVGGLPWPLFDGPRARQIVDAVEDHLWTPFGLRTLSPKDRGYCGQYAGDRWARDHAYHQGTVWPWLLGAFVDAWVRVRGGGASVQAAAYQRFVDPLIKHLESAGYGHVSEVFDGDFPYRPGGCPFQAWSLSELIWLDREVLADRDRSATNGRP